MSSNVMILPLFVFIALSCAGQQKVKNVPVKQSGGRYVIRAGAMEMEADPAIGGRITSLKLDGKDFLTGSEVNDFNWGSTLWPSPQSEWDWPPPATLDNKPYTVVVEGDELVMASEKDPKTGLSFTKRFSGNSKMGYFILKYVITNLNDTARKVSAWEVTRVKTQGIAFFPVGKGDVRGGLIPMTMVKDGICWFTYQSDKLPSKGDSQIYSDGSEGWFAQVNDGIMLVKRFPDIPFDKNAPAEGEVELYANKTTPEKSYVEVEHQGAYELLAPGSSSTWIMKWYLRKLPLGIKQEAGNKTLLKYARKLGQAK